MYSLNSYGQMLADRARTAAYARAIEKAVRPGSVVLEIGTGPGAFGVLACRLGARRVYAIEPDPVIQVARETAVANGCADRMVFIEDLSTRISLPERADVIVSDLRGVLPLLQAHLPSIADARKRFLAPNGTQIPQRDTIWASIIESPEQYAHIVDCWDTANLGIRLDPARQLVVNMVQKASCAPEELLAEPQRWAVLDYTTVESPDVRGSLEFKVGRPGMGHGIIAWFETTLIDDIGYSNAPGRSDSIYGLLFFPWTEPVALAPGQTISVDLQAALVEGDYAWRWNTQIHSLNGAGKARRFSQSHLGGAVLSLEKLRRSASDYVPKLSEDGRINRRALDLMDGNNSLDAIARQLAAEYPERFPRWRDALSYTARYSQQLSR